MTPFETDLTSLRCDTHGKSIVNKGIPGLPHLVIDALECEMLILLHAPGLTLIGARCPFQPSSTECLGKTLKNPEANREAG